MGLRRPLRRPLASLVALLALGGAGAIWAAGRTPDVAEPAVQRVVVPGLHVLPLHTPTPTPAPTIRPAYRRPSFVVAPGASVPSGPGSLRRFTVEVEEGIGIDPADFAREVEAVLWDERSWGGDGRVAFQRVSEGGSLRVLLATPDTTRSLCRPLDTGRTLSCYQHGRAVLNLYRWQNGSEYFPDLQTYRAYMINHEVGHGLGHGHVGCPGPGQPAPVMLQQTKGLQGCTANGWPLETER